MISDDTKAKLLKHSQLLYSQMKDEQIPKRTNQINEISNDFQRRGMRKSGVHYVKVQQAYESFLKEFLVFYKTTLMELVNQSVTCLDESDIDWVYDEAKIICNIEFEHIKNSLRELTNNTTNIPDRTEKRDLEINAKKAEAILKLERDKVIEKGNLSIKRAADAVLKEDDKANILGLVQMKVGKKIEKMAQSNVDCSNGIHNSHQIGNIATEFFNKYSEEIKYRSQLLLDTATSIATKKNCTLRDVDYKWIKNDMMEYIEKRQLAGEQSIQSRMAAIGKGDRANGPISRFKADMQVLRFSVIGDIDIAIKERKIGLSDMTFNKTRKFIKVFIGSPSDLLEERKQFRKVIDHINKIIGHNIGVQINAIGWEDTLPGKGRPQELINKDLRSSDLAVLLLGEKWGSPTGAYSSGFEEEYRIVSIYDINFWMFFREIPEERKQNPDPQLQKVLKFRSSIENEKKILFHVYKDENDWAVKFEECLSKWLFENRPEQIAVQSSRSLNDVIDGIVVAGKRGEREGLEDWMRNKGG